MGASKNIDESRSHTPPFLNNKSGKSESSSSSVTSYTCKNCEQPITSGHAYELGDEARWHIDCFQCNKCNKKLSNESDFLVLSTGALVCYECSDRCTICKSKIDELAIILSNSDEAYCRNCFKCSRCDDKISNLRYAKTKKGLYCINCHEKLIEKRKRYKLQQLNKANESRKSSASIPESDDGSEFDFSRVSSYEEARDLSNKAKNKIKQLPTVPLSELRKRREMSNNENWNGSERPRIASTDSDLFRYKPPDISEKTKFSSSESLINLSAHTTAENSPVVQQGHFATRSKEKLHESKQSTQSGLRSAPKIDIKTSDVDDESTFEVDKENRSVPPRSQPLYHARTLSQQKNELEMMTSPTVLGNKNVKSTPSRKNNHSRKPSIDDVLASTIHNQSTIDSDLLLNKTPLRNAISEIEDDGYKQIDTSMFHNGDDTAFFMDNKAFLNDENVQMALKMTSEISPLKERTIESSQDEYMTAFNSSNDLNKSLNEESGKKQLGRSLSLKSPKNFLQSLTKSPKSESHKRTGSTDSQVPSLPNTFSKGNHMYSSNPTMPLSEQTLMDGQQAKMKLNMMMNTVKEKKQPATHQRSISASSALQRSLHSRQASLDYMNTPKTSGGDFEKEDDGFQFGNGGIKNTDISNRMLEMRKLNIDVYNLENTKRILANEVESLTNQKTKLLQELSDLNVSIKAAEEHMRGIGADNNVGQPISHGRSESIVSNVSTASDKASVSQNSNNGRFWKNIFQKVEKTTKGIDKNSIKMSSSVSQPVLNLIPNGGTNNAQMLPRDMDELIRREHEYNDIEGSDIDTYTKLSTISSQVVQVRDLSVIGYCKVEGHEGIPYIIRFFVDFLQNNINMMRQEGIYRKAASKILVERFEKALYEKYEAFIGDYKRKRQILDYNEFYLIINNIINEEKVFMDVHLLASCFKRFLRRLLVPVIPYTCYFDVINDIKTKLNLPKEHEQTLKLILSHMVEVSKLESENKMTKYNLAMVFAPSLVRDLDNEREMMDFKERVKFIEYLLNL
ncbi:uncharacterized protein HGUI_02062 [Hanseniaspora guilliermondii]|uniref:Rho-type GTPase-activating protein 1 n=1 Tax=Hanseniaspora guilliermondii TaxID=56406 RepID=A0A1L0FJV0_9ASCO|nr:uncharacterized protein HGUI_02062 [Hanseniaspora guilliermondii]